MGRGYFSNAMPYAASKAALINLTKPVAQSHGAEGITAVASFTQNLARDYAQQNIRVNAVCPEADAAQYLRGLFGSLGDVLREKPASFAQLRADHSTKGGLNEIIFQRFGQGGGGAAMQAALTAAFKRVQG